MSTLKLKEKIRNFLGININHENVDYEILENVKFKNYSRLLIQYPGSENDPIKAYFFIPDGNGPFPSILVHHQHNSERHLGKSEVSGLVGDPFQAFCPAFAEHGIMCIAPDSICFEDRRKNKTGIIADGDKDFLQHLIEMSTRLLKGELLMTKVIEDSSIALSVLCHHELADRTKIGIHGHSYGGSTTIFHAPFDDRISYVCTSGAACSFRHKIDNNIGMEFSQIIPGFLNEFETVDLVKSISPKKLLIMSADDDKYTKDAPEIFDEASKVYEKDNVPHNIIHKRFKGAHRLSEENFRYIINWFVNEYGLK